MVNALILGDVINLFEAVDLSVYTRFLTFSLSLLHSLTMSQESSVSIASNTSYRCRQELSRDLRLGVITLHDAGFQHQQIRDHYLQKEPPIDISIRQISYAVKAGHPTPQKRGKVGQKGHLSEDQVDDLITYICTSKATRFESFLSLSIGPFSHFKVSGDVIRKAIAKRGYKKYIARQKPPLSQKNRDLRLAWAQEHKDWTLEDWCKILWTDETWVTGGRHRKQYVTRKAGEELHPDCVLTKLQRRKGWMFWGCFSGLSGKGPCLFWEKEWGSINQVRL